MGRSGRSGGGGGRSGGGRSGGSRMSSGRSASRSFSSSRSASGSLGGSRTASSLGGGRSASGSLGSSRSASGALGGSRTASSLGGGRSASGGLGSSRSSGWSRSGSSGSFSSSHNRPTTSRPPVGRSVTSSPSGSFTSHRPAAGRPNVTRQKPGVPTGSYMKRRPIYTGSLFGGGLFGGGNVIINVDNHQETYTNTSGDSAVYTEQQAQSTTQQSSASQQAQSTTQQTYTAQQTNTGQGVFSGTVYNDTVTTQSTPKKSGMFSTVITIAVWLLIISVLFSIVGGSSGQSGDYFTKSTVNREKLHLKLSDEAGYFTDECGWIRNRTTLENGLKDFYDSTGILPYVYIINNVGGDYDPSTEKLEQFAESKYEELFEDEGHVLLVFWDYAGAYEYTLWLGEDAAELMDTEACDILFDYLDYHYYYAATEEEFFADAFAEAGERMMSVTRSPMYYIIIVAVAGIAVFVLFKWWKTRKEKEAARLKRAEEILNSPLEKFGENGDIIDELEKKYEKEI